MRTTAIQPAESRITIIYPKILQRYSKQLGCAARTLQKDMPPKENLVYKMTEYLGNITMSVRRRGFFNAIKDFFGENPNTKLIEKSSFDHGVSSSFIIDGKRLYTNLISEEQIERLP